MVWVISGLGVSRNESTKFFIPKNSADDDTRSIFFVVSFVAYSLSIYEQHGFNCVWVVLNYRCFSMGSVLFKNFSK